MAAVGVVMAGLTGLAAYLYGPPTQRALTKFGVFRELTSSPLADPADLVVIKDTVQCEDLHYYAPSNTLFTACEDVYETRFKWFPPLGLFDAADLAWKSKGSIHAIDPEVSTKSLLDISISWHRLTNSQTKESKRLSFVDFDGPFITHGIDVIPDPENPKEAVYIFAINHPPNEAVFPRDGSAPPTDPATTTERKGASRIEVFHHVLGSDSVQYLRTIAHPLIRTPNDLIATSPTSVYVSNDHYYFAGRMRMVEDMFPGAAWSNVIHATVAADGQVDATVALDHMRNPNGVGHGRTEDEIVIASAVGGYINIGKVSGDSHAVVLNETIDLDSTIDNPTWFADPYANEATGDASGFVLGGLARGIDLPKTGHDPLGKEGVLVWYATPKKDGSGGWDKKLLWQDDGSIIRNTATAVLVGIDPTKENGAKKAWLFVTGFSSANAIAVKVDL